MMKLGELTHPYDPKFYGTQIPNIRNSLLQVASLASPGLRRQFPAAVFHKMLYGLLKFDHGEPTIHKDPFSRQETHRTWTVDLDELVQRWAHITRHSDTTWRNCRGKALAYYEALRALDLLLLEEREDGRYEVGFPELVQWQAQKQWELITSGALLPEDLAKLNRQHYFGNGCSWDLIFPYKKRLKILEGGATRRKRSVKVCARTWANYFNRIVTLNSRGILGGGCDYHVQSERPQKRKAIRHQRKALKAPLMSEVRRAKEDMKELVREQIEASDPTFRSWPPANATTARYHGHSLATEKRRLHMRDTVNVIRQALVMGAPVPGKVVGKLKAIRGRYGAQPLRFVPVRGRPGWYQPQKDEPSRVEFKKKYQNWALYPDIPAELKCLPEREGPIPPECLEMTIAQVTEHDSPHTKTRHKVLAPSTIRLAYLGDEGSSQMQEEMKAAGLNTYQGPWRKKKRVPARGCHHKDRTALKKKMMAEGTWRGTFPMDVLAETQADINRRVSPETLYRRNLRELKAIEAAEPDLRQVGPVPQSWHKRAYENWKRKNAERTDNEPHRGSDQDHHIDLPSNRSP
jgi:hypothetical protein